MQEVLRAVELSVGPRGDGPNSDSVNQGGFDAPWVRDVRATYRIAAVGWILGIREPRTLACKKETSARECVTGESSGDSPAWEEAQASRAAT